MSWYYLDATGQHTGSYEAANFKGLYERGYVTAETLAWADGRKDWQPLRSIPEIWETLAAATAPAAGGAATAAAQPAAGAAAELAAESSQHAKPGPMGAGPAAGNQPGRRKAAVVAKAAKAAPAHAAPEDSELAAFQAEMSALGAVPATVGADLDDEPLRAETPEPEDRRFQDDDGTWYVWDALLRKFVEEGVQPQMPEYKPEDMVFEMEEEKIPVYNPPKPANSDEYSDGEGAEEENCTDGSEKQGSQAKPVEKLTDAESVIEKHKEKAKRAREQEDKWLGVQNNMAVYVTGLPDDTTEAELVQFFAKCGILKEDDDGKPRVKLYKDRATGMLKGDGLVYYLKQPSVDLACKILDGGPFRDDPSKTITVQPAKFEMHGDTYVPKKKPKKKKKKVVKEDKVLGWGGFDDVLPPTQVTVILKHAFHPTELEEQPTAKTDLEADMASECAKLGPIDKIRVHQYHPEGVVSIKFKKDDAAQECLKLMGGRFFGGRQLSAELWDGITNYNVKKAQESEEEQAARLARFAAEIEQADE